MRFWKIFIELLDNIRESVLGIELFTDVLYRKETVPRLDVNLSPISKVGDKSILLLEENSDRVNLIIQNIGISPCYIKLGEKALLNDFHAILAADTYDNQGNGGSIELKNWHGEVYAICESETKVSVLEY